ncbi:hypothetical protein [uncultured Ruminococcus sp.]|uniref:hypothetical protein n=1 Tax=uncultured Ruminococcus sp. TaxID=165186 RepID=UPI0025E02C0F|nr:hypothetical protein [uncultured Ruminococcus sp.]
MSYSYVSKKVYKPFKLEFDAILLKMQKIMKTKYKVTMEIQLVGSGLNNCVTQDDTTGLWDLDYNIIIHKMSNDLSQSPGNLKNTIRGIIDHIKESGEHLKGYNVSFGKNSTVPITYKVKKGSKLIMSVDIAIIRYDKNCSLRLVFDKPADQYIGNEVSSKFPSDQDISTIKKNGMKSELRNRYLQKKNDKRNSKYPSYVLFNQAVNEVLQLIETHRNHSTSTHNKKEGKNMAKVSGNNHSKSQMNHHSNQSNPNNAAHRAAQNNRSNQLNPNNAQYKSGNNPKTSK